ncbi:MAG TPA: pitrilysin family protein [Vicinamibacterales bacterium]|nr:pitrilysin family protein [Vicinamibacterales bacterium]
MSRVDRGRLPTLGPSAPFKFPDIHRRVLSNGLEVRAIAHRNVPVVSASLLVPGGTAADPAGRHGLAAFTADLLDEGSAGRSALDVSDLLARYGADFDVDVGPDAIVLTVTTMTRFLAPALALLAEMVLSPNLAAPDIERVRKLRLERLRQMRDHAPAVAERGFMRLLYRDHPYGHLGVGSEDALEATTHADIQAFHAGAFVPSGATVVIAGDAPVDELAGLVVETFGSWETPRDVAAIHRLAGLEMPPLIPANRLAVVARPGSAQSELRIGHVCASRDTPDYHAMVLLNMILGGQFVSRVNMNLRQDKGYTYGVRTGFDLRRGLGPFVLQTSVGTDVTALAIREALKEVEDIRGSRPATAEELALARASVTRGYPRGFETAQQVARGVSSLALHGLPDTYFEEFVPRADAVTLDDIARVAQHYLDPARMVTLVVGDHAQVAPTLTALNLGEPIVLSAS